MNLFTLIVPSVSVRFWLTEPTSHPLLLDSENHSAPRMTKAVTGHHGPHGMWISWHVDFSQLCCHIRRRVLLFFLGACSFVLCQLNSFHRFKPDEKKIVFLKTNKHFWYQSQNCRNRWRLLPQNEIATVHSTSALQQSHRQTAALSELLRTLNRLVKWTSTLTEDYIW